jgi:VWFA-related protein
MRTLFAVLFLAVPLHAQLRESIEVNLLELDVVVLDRSGKPVDALAQEEFEVRLGGKRVDVTNFFAVKRGAIVEQRTPAASREEIPPETMIPTTVVILVDNTRLGPHAKKRAIDALSEYVRANVGANTSAMLAVWNGSLDVRTRPTERPGPLLAELEKMSREPAAITGSERRDLLRRIDDAMSGLLGTRYAHYIQNTWSDVVNFAENEASQIDRTLEGLREVTKLAAALEGRKGVLYVSEGLPMSAAADVFDYWQRVTKVIDQDTNAHAQEKIALEMWDTFEASKYDRSRQFQRVAREAQAANVPIYAVDAGGLRGYTARGMENTKTLAQVDTLLMRSNMQDGVRYVASETGGRFISEENDLGRAIAVVSEQFTTYYSLGVRAPASTRPAKVKVTVKQRPELRVLTARHRKPLSREEELQRAVRARLYNRRAENPLGAELSLGLPSGLGKQCVIPMHVAVSRETPLDLYFALLDDALQESDVRSANIVATHSLSLGVKPGRYVLSLAVADRASGETTYLQREIDARTCR